MQLPFKGNNRVTSPYGPRPDFNDNHAGIDIVGTDSTTVHSVCGGIVKASTIIIDKNNLTWQWGNYVRIDDDEGNQYFYCHMSQRLVSKGESVHEGQIIGVMGNTGYSFGAHLHFEVRDKTGAKLPPAGVNGKLPIANACGNYEQKSKAEQPQDKQASPQLFKIEIGPLSKGDVKRFAELAQELSVKTKTILY